MKSKCAKCGFETYITELEDSGNVVMCRGCYNYQKTTKLKTPIQKMKRKSRNSHTKKKQMPLSQRRKKLWNQCINLIEQTADKTMFEPKEEVISSFKHPIEWLVATNMHIATMKLNFPHLNVEFVRVMGKDFRVTTNIKTGKQDCEYWDKFILFD